MSKITKAEMDAWNQAATIWMEGLRQDIREEVIAEGEAHDHSETISRLMIAVIVNFILTVALTLVIVKTGILVKMGIVFTMLIAFIAIGTSLYLTYKWIRDGKDIEEYEIEYEEVGKEGE